MHLGSKCCLKAHNVFKLGYDSILSSLDSPPTDDLANFLGYCEAWAESIGAHHASEVRFIPFFFTVRTKWQGIHLYDRKRSPFRSLMRRWISPGKWLNIKSSMQLSTKYWLWSRMPRQTVPSSTRQSWRPWWRVSKKSWYVRLRLLPPQLGCLGAHLEHLHITTVWTPWQRDWACFGSQYQSRTVHGTRCYGPKCSTWGIRKVSWRPHFDSSLYDEVSKQKPESNNDFPFWHTPSHTPPDVEEIWPGFPWILRKVVVPYIIGMRHYG